MWVLNGGDTHEYFLPSRRNCRRQCFGTGGGEEALSHTEVEWPCRGKTGLREGTGRPCVWAEEWVVAGISVGASGMSGWRWRWSAARRLMGTV